MSSLVPAAPFVREAPTPTNTQTSEPPCRSLAVDYGTTTSASDAEITTSPPSSPSNHLPTSQRVPAQQLCVTVATRGVESLEPISQLVDVPLVVQNQDPVTAPTSRSEISPVTMLALQSETPSDDGFEYVQPPVSLRPNEKAATVHRVTPSLDTAEAT